MTVNDWGLQVKQDVYLSRDKDLQKIFSSIIIDSFFKMSLNICKNYTHPCIICFNSIKA